MQENIDNGIQFVIDTSTIQLLGPRLIEQHQNDGRKL